MGGPGSGRKKGGGKKSGGEKTLKANLKKPLAFKNAPVSTVKNLMSSGNKSLKGKKGKVALKNAKRGERYRTKAKLNYNSKGL